MPLALAFIAILLLVAAFRNTYQQLFTQLGQDLPGFAIWLGAIVTIGLIGYIPKMEPISRMLLALVFIVIVLKNKGAFANFTAAFGSAPPAVTEPAAAQAPLGSVPVQLTITEPAAAQAPLGGVPAQLTITSSGSAQGAAGLGANATTITGGL